MGWISASGTRTSSPTVIDVVIASMNSANCVARTIEYGSSDSSMSFSWATFARRYPLLGSWSEPTIDTAT